MAPEIQVAHFELKPLMFNMLNSIGQFGGSPNEDAIQHVRAFIEVSDLFRQQDLPKGKEKDEGSKSLPTDGGEFIATLKVSPPPAVAKVRLPPPSPQWLKKHNDEIQFKKFVDVLDKLYINIPLLEAIDQMPFYAKFFKDIVMNNRKQRDPGSFVILCSIGDNNVGRALCDLGSSLNMMPQSIFIMLGMGNARPTTMILQLSERSQIRPEGRIEDIIVKVDKFVFLVEFLILNCEADDNAPVILGHLFLATKCILIDFDKGEFTMRVANQRVTINVFKTLKYIDDSEECH
ncbi:uncharacterized protein LOC120177572 [Hibiscus syriacus]|uniref:uncharacterized protein LOC120177572 n=1 Tax=Hibiscus syriacus TaxID=106335 RepID=UPI001920A1E4|nr:uncharacterized protein LOC120177572 [Hibiscus syriacus]